MIASGTANCLTSHEAPSCHGGRPPLLAPGAWIDSKAACPAERLVRLREALAGRRPGEELDLRPDPRRPGIYGVTLDGWAYWLIVYPGGRGARVLAASPIGPCPGA